MAAIIAVELLVVIKFGANVFEVVDVAVAVAGWLAVVTTITLAATAGTLLWKKLKVRAERAEREQRALRGDGPAPPSSPAGAAKAKASNATTPGGGARKRRGKSPAAARGTSGAKTCRCGSTEHKRTSHRSCSLNPTAGSA